MKAEHKYFLRTYVKALIDGTAAVFAGAGLSQPSGYVNWKELLRETAEHLGLSVDHETDLIAVAQYHVNHHNSRGHINQLLVDEFTRDAQLTENHRLLASMPIDTIWTTNYDKLLERSFSDAGKRIDVKISSANLAVTVPGRVVTIYKMHGDIQHPEEAVLTKDDYETYNVKRSLFSEKLQGDLVGRTFLFLGFSLTDPNIDHILARVRSLLGENQRPHFCVLKRVTRNECKDDADFAYEANRQQHRIADLRRYCIQTVLIDDYGEITELLQELNRRSHQRDVFVSGSAQDFDPLGKDKLTSLCRVLGKRLIEKDFNVVSGFGLGIGGEIILGAMEILGHNDEHRLHLRPFPQQAPPGMKIQDFWREYRERMISRAGSCVFISGNKMDNGKVVPANGVTSEFDICCEQGKYPIPIGATGHVAKELWDTVTNSLDTYFPGKDVKADFEIIGDSNKSEEELIAAVLHILNTISR